MNKKTDCMVVNTEYCKTEWTKVDRGGVPLRWKPPVQKKPHKRKLFDNEDNMIVSIKGNLYLYPPKAGVVIFSHDFKRVLLVSNNYDDTEKPKLGLPKGHVENNERYEICASRELEEETGIKIKIDQNSHFLTVNNSKYYVFVLDRESEYNLSPRDKKEIKDCLFTNINDFKNLSINKETGILLSKKYNLAKKYAVPIKL